MIAKLKYGNTNTFLIRGESGTLLVDTDYAGTLPGFYCHLRPGQAIEIRADLHGSGHRAQKR